MDDKLVTNPNPKLKFEDYIATLKGYADTTYNQAVENAEINRQKEVLAAGNAYRSALANSGAKAQALSSMGLTGSGYSTYLDSQAYAQKQGAVNSAYQNEQNAINQAQAAKDTAYMNAEGLYVDYLQKQETNRKNAYQGIYDKLSTLSLSDIDRLGATMGLDQTDIDALKTAKNDMTYASLLGSDYGQVTLDNLVRTGQLYADGSAYNDLKNNMITLTSTQIDHLFDGVDYKEAKATLEDMERSGIDVTAVKEKFNNTYNPITANVTFKKDGGLKVRTGKAGNNIKLEGEDGTIYRVQYNGDTLSDENNVAKTLPSGTVFMYNGVIYIKQSDGKSYAVEARPFNSNYNDLVKLFKK